MVQEISVSEKLESGPLATFVPNKMLPLYNWFYYKEGFARDLVIDLLKEWNVKGPVLDPFCGSGTTLLAAKERGLDAWGLDAQPISVLASRVKTADWDTAFLKSKAEKLFSLRFERPETRFPFFRYFNRHVLDDVLLFYQEVKQMKKPARDFFLLALIVSAVRVSWIWKDGAILKVKKHPVPPFRKFFKRRIKVMLRDLDEAAMPRVAMKAERKDAASFAEKERFDAVITSPPYLGQIDYSRVYAIENWFAGGSVGKSVRWQTDEEYFTDMKRVLGSIKRALKSGGHAGLVVGNAYFPKEDRHVECDKVLADLAKKEGLIPKEIRVLNRRKALQRRTVVRGEVRESLIILQKQ